MNKIICRDLYVSNNDITKIDFTREIIVDNVFSVKENDNLTTLEGMPRSNRVYAWKCPNLTSIKGFHKDIYYYNIDLDYNMNIQDWENLPERIDLLEVFYAPSDEFSTKASFKAYLRGISRIQDLLVTNWGEISI